MTLEQFFNWRCCTFRVSDYVTPTGQVKVRFSVNDNPENGTITEACVDDFKLVRYNFTTSNYETVGAFGTVGAVTGLASGYLPDQVPSMGSPGVLAVAALLCASGGAILGTRRRSGTDGSP